MNIPVSATFATGGAGNGVINFKACDNASCTQGQDYGSYNVTVTAPAVTVTPDGSARTRLANGAYAEVFTVTNLGPTQLTLATTCLGTGTVTCNATSPASLVLAGNGGSATDTAFYNVGAVGSGVLKLVASGGGVSDTGSYNISAIDRTVAVRPELTVRQNFASTAGSQRFFIKNLQQASKTYNLSFQCSGLTGCAVSPTSMTLAPGESKVATLTYTAGSAGSTGDGMVKAVDAGTSAYRDSSSVAVTGVAPLFPVVSIVDANPGASRDRSQCLTISAGSDAAFECGDLRIIHPLPAIRTISRARVPTLLYNSAPADPFSVVAATVTLTSVPDSVEAVLLVNGVEKARTRWAGSDWSGVSPQTRRIAIGSAVLGDTTVLADTTKTIPYTLEVATISGAARNATSVQGELVQVSRRRSALGAGWWLAGLERLHLGTTIGIPFQGGWINTPTFVTWVGGDGSTQKYVGLFEWVGSTLDRPDTLRKEGSYYVRRLPGGVRVLFNSSGQHVYTINRLSDTTTFTYTSGRLTTIKLPTRGGGQLYTFAYDGNNYLSSVTAPRVRVTTFSVNAQRIDLIRDPDSATVQFTYESPSSRRVASRTDRRGTVTSYSYDAAKKLSSAQVDLQPDFIRLGFSAADVIGLATATPKTATDTANVSTSVFGARHYASGSELAPQQTKFWLDRYGAPRRIVNQLGHQTLLKREEGQWFTLVTELVSADTFTTRAAYDPRGNIIRSTAVAPFAPVSNQDAITRFHWDPRWDFVDSLITPTGVAITMAYDTTNGNRVWQQTGNDVARRTTFRYNNTFKLLSATVLPLTPADSIDYDVLGNVAAIRTPLVYWTSFYKDSLGRDTLVVTPNDSIDHSRGPSSDATIRTRNRTIYTVMDRDSITESIAPNATQLVRVEKSYDKEGNLLLLTRRSIPDSASIGAITTQWRYDRANRAVAEIAHDGQVDSTDYDPAGNAVAIVSRRKNPTSGAHLTITSRYDTLNRLVMRILPDVPYGRDSVGSALYLSRTPLNRGFPYYPNNPQNGYTAWGDTTKFAYDVMGKDTLADNRDARVRRAYYRNGMLRAESLKVRTLAELASGGDFQQHSYGITYRYDLDGGRIVLKYPVQLAPALKDSSRFTYDAVTGELVNVWDPLGNQFVYHYNARGEMDTLRYASTPGAVFDARTYNHDGSLVRHVVSGSRRDAALKYDARQKVIWSANTFGAKDTLIANYSGLGHLLNSRLRAWGVTGNAENIGTETIDTLSHDALGNLTRTSFVRSKSVNQGAYTQYSTSTRANFYELGTGRLRAVRDYSKDVRDTVVYDSAGSTKGQWQSEVGGGTAGMENRLSYYGADGSVRAADYRRMDGSPTGTGPNRFVFEEYRYDAYGRRVWVRVRGDCDGIGGDETRIWGECRTDLVRRTVWDGFQELVEIQQLGGDGDPIENDTTPLHRGAPDGIDQNPLIGRVLYTYGNVLDQPLSLIRMAYADSVPLPPQLQRPWVMWQPFSFLLLWNHLGEVDRAMFGAGDQPCKMVNGVERCVIGAWPFAWSALQVPEFIPWYWHGTVTANKRDKAQTLYKRYRVYDPLTGRFTQEDPIGLAGGLNLYGFAGGDPVNFSDPFGLDTLRIQSAELARAVATLREESAAFNRQMVDLERSTVVTNLREGAADPRGGRVVGGNVVPIRMSDGQVQEQTITINAGTMRYARDLFQRTGRSSALDLKDVLGHEVGHAASTARTKQWGSCPDPDCSVRAENTVRRDRDRPPRTRY